MEIAINHFGNFAQKVQSVISRLADIVIPWRTLAVDLQLLLGVFKRIALVAQQMFYEFAHLDILRCVSALTRRNPVRLQLIKRIFPEAQSARRDIQHCDNLADAVVGFLGGRHYSVVSTHSTTSSTTSGF